MLGRGGRHTSLAGRLLLSTALVAVSLAYGWWKRDHAGPGLVPPPAPPAAEKLSPPHGHPTAQKEAPASVAQMTPPQNLPGGKARAGATPSAPSQGAAPPLTALASLRMYQPPAAQTPLPLVTGTPAPGATVPLPAGAHLEDGEYLGDSQQYEWGDLQVKILIQGGRITGAQIVQYPDHRAESLEISQMAAPRLCSELIKTQQAKVDIVSSATDTSYVFRDAAASAIGKATR